MRRMGCVGDVIVAGGIDALNNSDTVFVADFLRELFGNIARYADSTQRYVVLVSAAQVADYLVQSRINETRRKVAEAIRRVEELTAKLRAKYSYFN